MQRCRYLLLGRIEEQSLSINKVFRSCNKLAFAVVASVIHNPFIVTHILPLVVTEASFLVDRIQVVTLAYPAVASAYHIQVAALASQVIIRIQAIALAYLAVT
jgi:hypothetical protein